VTQNASNTKPETRVVMVVEDEDLLRDLIARALEERGFTVHTAATAADAKRVFRGTDPDALLVDVNLGAGPNGFDLVDVLLTQAPYLAVVFLTNLPDPRFADRDSGALPKNIAYLRKSAISDIDAVVNAVDATMRGVVSEDLRHDRDKNRPFGNLTRNQVEILRLIAEGKSNIQIAEHRGVTVKAVEDSVRRTCDAIGIPAHSEGNSRVNAARAYLTTAK